MCLCIVRAKVKTITAPKSVNKRFLRPHYFVDVRSHGLQRLQSQQLATLLHAHDVYESLVLATDHCVVVCRGNRENETLGLYLVRDFESLGVD